MLILIDVVRYWTSGGLGTDSSLLDGRSTPDDRGPNNLGARLEGCHDGIGQYPGFQ